MGSGNGIADLTPVVDALQDTITSGQIVNFFATGVMVALPLILTWFGCKWIYRRFTSAVKRTVEVKKITSSGISSVVE